MSWPEPAAAHTPPDHATSAERQLDPRAVTIIGAGPAGLMAAEVLSRQGMSVQVLDAMPSAGRKFLLAGKGGLNLTHSEGLAAFTGRYAERAADVAPWLARLGPDALRAWAEGLGVPTFVGSSGRVFPVDMKAAPLLRHWLVRLRAGGVRFLMRHRWDGWTADGGWCIRTPSGIETIPMGATVLLALGGASWARLGSDGAWWPWLAERGVALAPLRPSNCGFDVPDPGWSAFLRERFAGAPLKGVVLTVPSPSVGPGVGGAAGLLSGADEPAFRRLGEFVLTATGIEGSLVYAASAAIRRALDAETSPIEPMVQPTSHAGPAPDSAASSGTDGTPGLAARDAFVTVSLDLLPDRSAEFVITEVNRPRGSRSLATHLKSRLNLDGAKAALLFELLGRDGMADAARVAAAIKQLPIRLACARPIDEAISTAGGVQMQALDEHLMLRQLPGVFVAGEMLDWEAPTGGYLLTACMASGALAGEGAAAWQRAREV
jgi:uncharacterized flavoprotein (TIGR03862 family)